MTGEFMRMLETANTAFLAKTQRSLEEFLTSGFRCPEHNTKEGGGKASAHLSGQAADFFFAGNPGGRHNAYLALKCLLEAGFTRLGMGKRKYPGIVIHVDCASGADHPQELLWGY
jgi:hypothetical protein